MRLVERAMAPQGNNYLLEIGTEELPLEFLLSAPTELIDKVKAALDEQAVGYGDVSMYVTPRRLALVIRDLPELQEARTFKTKGPPIRVAMDADGKPTQAGLGFARKVNVDFSQLTQETIEGETYMVLNQAMAGRPVKELLSELLPDLVLSLSGSHFMAWGSNTIRFSRPIRWLVSLWNDTHLPMSIGPVTSDLISHGHRVLSDGPVRIESVDNYLPLLEREGAVLADQNRRKDLIWKQLQEAAKAVGGDVAENEGLLDTVNMLVEQPSVVMGRFKEEFLEIPDTVITTVMAAHQKYFPVYKGSDLQPCFLTVSNGRKETAGIIRHGNEKVLTARLEDARFFYLEDQKIPLQDRLEKLKGITFQKGLGSMYEKTRRLETLSLKVSEALGHKADKQKHVQRGAMLAKADLVTGMVFEFTELQGVMGRRYAQLSGEPQEVAEAIYEHYLPRFNGDEVARSQAGIAVSLADKLDTIVAVFSQKNAKLPSGSKDPLGLRRMASGMIMTVLENNLSVDLLALFQSAYRQLVESIPVPETTEKSEKEKNKGPQFQDEQTTIDLVRSFVMQRLRGMLLEQGNRYDIVDAALEAEADPLSDIRDVLARIDHLKKLTLDTEGLKKVYEPANRIYKILGEQYDPAARTASIKAELFRDPSEQALFDQVKTLETQMPALDYGAIIPALSGLNEAIELFFEKVMVNDPDEAVRKNRYNLLSVLNRFYLQLACFTKLIV